MFFGISKSKKRASAQCAAGTPIRSEQIDFANYVLAKYGGMLGSNVPKNYAYELECQQIIAQHKIDCGENANGRMHLLKVAGDQIKPASLYDLHVKNMCYLCAGARCRNEFITTTIDLLHSNLSYAKDPHFERKSLLGYLAKSYFDSGQYYKALEIYENLMEISPENIGYFRGAVSSLCGACAFDTALELIRQKRKSTLYKMSDRRFHKYLLKKANYDAQRRARKLGFERETIRHMPPPDSNSVSQVNYFRNAVDLAELQIAAAIVSKRDRDNYAWIQSHIPDHCPKSYSAYKRMKNQNTKNFQVLSSLCSKLEKDINLHDIYTDMAIRFADIQKTRKLNEQ